VNQLKDHRPLAVLAFSAAALDSRFAPRPKRALYG